MNLLSTVASKQLPPSRSLTLRLLVIGFLILIFIYPTYLVQNLISERSDRQANAVREVSSKWGESQTLVGPILVVPYYPYGPIATTKGSIDPAQTRLAYFVPESLKVEGDLKSQLRSRGIYKVPLYEGAVTITGSFANLDLGAAGLTADKMFWDRAYVVMGGLDMGGLTSHISLNWAGAQKRFAASNKSKLFSQEISAAAPIASAGERKSFSVALNLRGSGNFYVVPVAKETQVHLNSDWPTPSFDGAFLPAKHTVSKDGFSGEWGVYDLNRSLPAAWTDAQNISFTGTVQNIQYQPVTDPYSRYPQEQVYNYGEFGVRFFLPVDIYQKTTRSAKYAMAVIGLVFLIFFLVEAAARRRVNPLQYILVGLALCIFYTLLLSLSEYLAFGLAYLMASLAIVGMIGLFTKSILNSWHLGAMTGALLAFLYGFVFILLQSKDYTLLVGSIGLFIMLGIIMYFSRYINWYSETTTVNPES